ncbi:UNVERIFIED_CONTAM: hypothetical protein GTU68_022528 [Idotea baltica]|nr:hypothetical protein [Idotea baltica]
MGWLNTFIIYVALPALFFKLLSKTPVEKLASWDFIGANIGVTFAIFALTFCLGLFTSGRRVADATMQGLAGSYGNIGYMGPALAILTFGEQAAVPVALIFCFENVLHFVNAPALMAIARDDNVKKSTLVLGVIRSIILHPFIIATAIGVAAAFLDLTPPAPIESLIAYLSQAAAPCALFAMGVMLALRPLKRVPIELGYLVPIKLIVHPAAMYLVLSYVGNFDPIWVYTGVLMAALPTATNVFVMAQQYGVWVERVSATILLTTITSVLTISALLFAIKTGAIPADLFP